MTKTAQRKAQHTLARKLAKATRELTHAESQVIEWRRDVDSLQKDVTEMKQKLAAQLRAEECRARVWHVDYGAVVVAVEIPDSALGLEVLLRTADNEKPMLIRVIEEAP